MNYNATKIAEKVFPFLDKALQHFGRNEIWWRGQSNSSPDWKLLPSIFRRIDSEFSERNLTQTFKRKALSRYQNCPQQNDGIGWLFLMQHYRLPTRLLDWSESFLVATFFSVIEKLYKDKPGALWALSPVDLNTDQFEEKGVLLPDGDMIKPLIRHAFVNKAEEIKKICAVSSKEIDSRLMTQLSVFTIHGYNQPLESLSNHEKYLIKFEIPSELKVQLINMLYDLGIRRSNIFPDLENLAKDLSAWFYSPID